MKINIITNFEAYLYLNANESRDKTKQRMNPIRSFPQKRFEPYLSPLPPNSSLLKS